MPSVPAVEWPSRTAALTSRTPGPASMVTRSMPGGRRTPRWHPRPGSTACPVAAGPAAASSAGASSAGPLDDHDAGAAARLGGQLELVDPPPRAGQAEAEPVASGPAVGQSQGDVGDPRTFVGE